VNTFIEIFWQFFRLGLTAFGGPAAHIAYFNHTFVEKLRWIESDAYLKLVALSHFLPGPGSSQVGYAIGLHRGGFGGGIAAFVGFTLPAFLLLLFIAMYQPSSDNPTWQALVHGLKLIAVIVITDAILSMSKKFCQTTQTIWIAGITAILLWSLPYMSIQLLVLISAGAYGHWMLQSKNASAPFIANQLNRASGLLISLVILGSLLFLWIDLGALWEIFALFFQTGTFVFGGGHVVLPLLNEQLEGRIDADVFLSGYALAQAVPGPMFSLAAFLGYEMSPASPVIGAIIATIAVFLPGLVLVYALKSSWEAWSERFSGALIGISAAVVGLLISVLFQPVFTGSVLNTYDMAFVLFGLLLLRTLKTSVIILLLLAASYRLIPLYF